MDVRAATATPSSWGRRWLAAWVIALAVGNGAALALHEPVVIDDVAASGGTVEDAVLFEDPDAPKADAQLAATSTTAAVGPGGVAPPPAPAPAAPPAPPAGSAGSCPAVNPEPVGQVDGAGTYATDADGGGLRRLLSTGASSVSADGTRFLFAVSAELLCVGPTAGGPSSALALAFGPDAGLTGRLSPDGSRVALIVDPNRFQYWSHSYEVWVYDVGSGALTNVTPVGAAWYRAVAWSPDGQWLATADDDRVAVIGADGSNGRTLVSGTNWADDGLRWRGDGGAVLAEATSLDVHVVPVDGSPAFSSGLAGYEFDWSRDGRGVANGDNELRLRAADGTITTFATPAPARPGWTRDGSVIYVRAGSPWSAWLFDPATLTERLVFEAAPVSPGFLQVEPMTAATGAVVLYTVLHNRGVSPTG